MNTEKRQKSKKALQGKKALQSKQTLQGKQALQSKNTLQSKQELQGKQTLLGKKVLQGKQALQSKNTLQSKQELQGKKALQSKNTLQSKKTLQGKKELDTKKKQHGKRKQLLMAYGLCFLWLAAVYFIFRFRLYIVLSGSMEPILPVGAVAVTDSVSDEWREGDIITFQKGSSIITHRIIRQMERVYQTKGDANAEPDSDPVRQEEVIGKVVFCIPYLGYLISTVWKYRFVFPGIAAAAVLAGEVGHGNKKGRNKKAEAL